MRRVCALALLILTAPVAADDIAIERLATCQDSWLDFRDDPARAQAFSTSFRSAFTPKGDAGAFAPVSKATVVGLPIIEVYPESVGMGVGFSVVLDASFDTARAAVEKAVGKPFTDCETGDGMRMCGRELAEKRTLTLMADASGASRRALLGCYYFYAR